MMSPLIMFLREVKYIKILNSYQYLEYTAMEM